VLKAAVQPARLVESLDSAIERRRAFLVDYQDPALAARYLALVQRVRAAEEQLGGTSLVLTDAVMKAYFKTLAYKDEYEVARLHTATGFLDSLRRDYGNRAKLRFHLAPPFLNSKRDARGRPRKKEFGTWIVPFFRLLAKMRRFRGTRLDLFGMTAERRMERQLITEFESVVESLLQGLDKSKLENAANLVSLFLEIRGYGPVKEAAADKVRQQLAAGLAEFSEQRRAAA
ncbi:MAG: DUF6537 domain-containing protein, partial [Woeseia sp.]